MVDTVHLKVPREDLGAIGVENIADMLTSPKHEVDEDGLICLKGRLGQSCRVFYKEGKELYIKGSLAKYYLDNNIQTLTRSDCMQAIQKLSDSLHLPIDKAKITRLDISTNLVVAHRPETYFPYLGESRYCQRLTQPSAVYWQNGIKTKLVYNKIEEAKSKKVAIPESIKDQNLFRFEMRYTKRVNQSLKRPDIRANLLADERFYIQLVNSWVDEYNAIDKYHQIKLDKTKMKTPKDFFYQMAMKQIQSMGQNSAIEYVEELRAENVFPKPEYYSRIKREIKDMFSKADESYSTDLIDELNKKVNQVKSYYR